MSFSALSFVEDNNREFDLGFKRGKRLGDMENFSKLYLPEDIVEQILPRLPPKSLMRFKCVCKLWYNVITSPNFITKHLSLSRHNKLASILFKHTILEDKSIKDRMETLLSSLKLRNGNGDLVSSVVEDLNLNLPLLSVKTTCKERHLEISGHCDGMICVRLCIGNVVLCNPAIKEFKLLPKSCLLLPKEDDEFLFYDLKYYTDFLGFGYDPKGKDYKVVRCVVYDESHYDESHYWFRAEVYTVGTNSWREIETKYNDIDGFVHWPSDQHVFFNGVYYWRVSGSQHGEFLLSFDMGAELFHETLFPVTSHGIYCRRLTVWKESIALVTTAEEPADRHSFDIWVMMNDIKGSWTKHLTIRPAEDVGFPLIYTYPWVFWKSEELLMVAYDKRVVSYNLGTRTFKYLPFDLVGHSYYTQAIVYVDSIVSVNGGNKLEGIDHSAFYGVETLANGRLRAI